MLFPLACGPAACFRSATRPRGNADARFPWAALAASSIAQQANSSARATLRG